MGKYRYVGSHADSLASGRPIGPGEYVTLSQEEERDNDRLIDEGALIPAEEPKAARKEEK